MCRGCGRDRLIKPYGLDCIYWTKVSANTFVLIVPTDARKLVGHGDHENFERNVSLERVHPLRATLDH
jgi:hypothetical protein